MSKNDVSECTECGCAVINKRKHQRWHERVVMTSRTSNHAEVTEESITDSRFIGMGEA